jgi:hypothetical protein
MCICIIYIYVLYIFTCIINICILYMYIIYVYYICILYMYMYYIYVFYMYIYICIIYMYIVYIYMYIVYKYHERTIVESHCRNAFWLEVYVAQYLEHVFRQSRSNDPMVYHNTPLSNSHMFVCMPKFWAHLIVRLPLCILLVIPHLILIVPSLLYHL